jgi:hypothetical protein
LSFLIVGNDNKRPLSFLSTFSKLKAQNFPIAKNGDPPPFCPLLVLSKLRAFSSLAIGDGNPPPTPSPPLSTPS